ncbi:MAG: GNAT family N-acetyltransferase [Gammaproteobacteria bacterium]|nr:GNAT family N-acetyltransferase [Gammaproteobacteria bacterium]
MTIEVFSNLDTIPEEIAAGLSLAAGLPFFESIEWFRCLARHGLDAGTPRLYVSKDNDDLQSALFCLAKGRQLSSLTNFYTIEYGPVMRGADAMTGLRDIASYIAGERPRWNTIDLRNLHETELASLDTVLSASGFATHRWEQHKNWFLDVGEQSFEQYFETLSSQLRNTIERKSRKAEREHELRLAVYPGDGLTLDEATRHYQQVYAASWKQPEPFTEFMPALLKMSDEHNLCRVGLAWVDGEPAAAQIWLDDGDPVFIYKLAYDRKFAELSIGSLLSKKMFQNAIDVDRVLKIDYGVGDEPYKHDWMSDCQALSGLMACNRSTARGLLTHLRESLSARKP